MYICIILVLQVQDMKPEKAPFSTLTYDLFINIQLTVGSQIRTLSCTGAREAASLEDWEDVAFAVLVTVEVVERSIPLVSEVWADVALHLMEQVQVVHQLVEYIATAALMQQNHNNLTRCTSI